MPEESPSAGRLGGRFRLLWAATGASNLGDGVGLVALPLLAASLTRDPLQIAAVAAAQRLPWLLFVLISGVTIDRTDRRQLQQVANVGRALVLAALGGVVWFGWASIPLLLGIALLLGVAETLADTAAVALLPAVVPRDRLEQANGRLYTTQTVANEFIGPPVGGGLFALTAAAPLLLVAGCYGLAATLVSLLRGSFQPASREPWSLRLGDGGAEFCPIADDEQPHDGCGTPGGRTRGAGSGGEYSKHTIGPGLGEGLDAVAHLDLAVDILNVRARRIRCNGEPFGDFAVRESRRQQGQHLPLAQAQRLGKR